MYHQISCIGCLAVGEVPLGKVQFMYFCLVLNLGYKPEYLTQLHLHIEVVLKAKTEYWRKYGKHSAQSISEARPLTVGATLCLPRLLSTSALYLAVCTQKLSTVYKISCTEQSKWCLLLA